MITDPRYPWLEPATFTEPTVDQMLRMRQLSGYDATARIEADCSACNDSGVREHVTHDARGLRIVYDIACDQCDAYDNDSQMPEIWDERRREQRYEDGAA
jgi:hypothetical protein